MSPISSSTSGLGSRYGVNHDMSPPAPAMNPSADIVTEYSSLAMRHLRRAIVSHRPPPSSVSWPRHPSVAGLSRLTGRHVVGRRRQQRHGGGGGRMVERSGGGGG